MGVHSAVAKEEIPTPSAQPPEAPGTMSLELLQVREQTDGWCMLCVGPLSWAGVRTDKPGPAVGTHSKDVGQQGAQINPMPVSAPKDTKRECWGRFGLGGDSCPLVGWTRR